MTAWTSTKSLSLLLGITAISCWSGCAACHPIKGVPAPEIPLEWRGESRKGRRTINLDLLQRRKPDAYLLDTGDVLAIHIEGVLIPPESNLLPPVHFPQKGEVSPSWGFPIPVRFDGSISVPQVGSFNVRGMTVHGAEKALRRLFAEKNILKHANDQVVVNLQRPRTYRVVVVRQEAGPMPTSTIGSFNPGATPLRTQV